MLLFHVFVEIPTSMGFGIHTWRCSNKSGQITRNHWNWLQILSPPGRMTTKGLQFPPTHNTYPFNTVMEQEYGPSMSPKRVGPTFGKNAKTSQQNSDQKTCPWHFFRGGWKSKLPRRIWILVLKVEFAGYLPSFVVRPPSTPFIPIPRGPAPAHCCHPSRRTRRAAAAAWLKSLGRFPAAKVGSERGRDPKNLGFF